MNRRYGCLNFIFDCIMTMLTAGFWLIWIFIREMRRHNITQQIHHYR